MLNLSMLPIVSRLQNMFMPQDQNQQVASAPELPFQAKPQPQMPLGQPPIRFSDFYKPDTTMEDQFNQSVMNMPQRQAPSKLRRLGAMLYSLNSDNPMQAADQYNNYHYYQALKDWQTKNAPLQLAADNERQSNNVMRQMAGQQMVLAQNDRKQTETERENKAKDAATQQKIKNSEDRTRIMQFKAEHPTLRPIISKGGTVQFMDPITHEIIDTGVDTGTMSDADKYDILHNNKMEEIQAQGQNQQDLETHRNTDVLGQIGARTAGAKEVKGTIPGKAPGATDKELPPSQQTTGQNMRARQAISEHPEWAKYIQFDQNGKFIKVAIPEAGFGSRFGLGSPAGDPEVAKQVNAYIFGTPKSSAVTPITTNANMGSFTKPAVPAIPTVDYKTKYPEAQYPRRQNGKVLVEFNGKPGYIPASQLADALASGYVEVK